MTKLTPQLQSAILAGFADGISLRTMCRKAGISRSVFLKWMNGDPDLTWDYEDAQLLHAEALVDDCIAIGDDPRVQLGEERPGDAGGEADILRRARFRIEARLKVARIYFKRHEAVLARRMREEELMVLAENADEDGDEPATPVAEPAVARQPNRKARRAAKAAAKHRAPLRLAAVSAQREPAVRRVGSTG